MAYSGSFRKSIPLPSWYLIQESGQEVQTHDSPSACQQSSALHSTDSRLEVPEESQVSSGLTSTPSIAPPSVAHLATRSRLVLVPPSPCKLLTSDSFSDVGTPRAFTNLTNRHKKRRPHGAAASRHSQHTLALEGQESRTSRRKSCRAIYQELVDTEESYLDSLHTVLDLFMRSMERSNAIPHRDFRLLFPAQLEQLIKIHSDLLQNMKLNDEEEIGTIFLHFLGSQQVGCVYGAYMNSFQTSCQMLHKYLLDSYFRTVYEACLLDPRCRGLDLLAHLLTPIQRLPRYLLLLKELLRQLQWAAYTPLDQAVSLLEAELMELDDAILQANHCHVMQGYRQLRRNRKGRRPKESSTSWSSSSSLSSLSTSSHLKQGDTASVISRSPAQPSLSSQQQMCASSPQLQNCLNHTTSPVGRSAHSMGYMSLLDLHSTRDSASKSKDSRGFGKLIKKLFHKKQ